jgi:hypothetical protein
MVGRVLLTGVCVAAMAGVAAAEERGPDPLSPAELLNGPSLHETGRIARTPVVTPLPAAAGSVPVRPDTGDKGERSIQEAAAKVAVPRPPPHGTINPGALDTEVGEYFARLDDCRIDVARRRKVAPADVPADALTLRWTIRRNGTVGATEVVAVSPTDLDVVDCVKAEMSTWTFSRPHGGPVPVERDF